MSGITELPWDSRVLGGRAGQVTCRDGVPSKDDLSAYDYLHVRVPQSSTELVGGFEAAGFRYITMDFELEKAPASPAALPPVGMRLEMLAKRPSPFPVKGFAIEGSRLFLDRRLRERLPTGFWDGMIREHCASFADYVLVAVDTNGCLAGIVSCFNREGELEMFLVAVHPSAQGKGVGAALLAEAERRAAAADQRVTTRVVAANTAGMNFYLRHGFRIRSGDVILHYSR